MDLRKTFLILSLFCLSVFCTKTGLFSQQRCSCTTNIDKSEETEIKFMFDKERGIVIIDGMLYFASGKLNEKEMTLRAMNEVITSNTKTSSETSHVAVPSNTEHARGEEELATGSKFWGYVLMVLVLTVFAGLMSGLTVGYLSIDDLVLELKQTTGTDEEKEYASKVRPILSKRHWLLVTLLVSNAFAMETLPLCLDKIVPEYLAVIISVTLVLFFGEVIPQAVCTGPDQIKIAAYLAPMTYLLMQIVSPISYPIAILLDRLLGEHHTSRFKNSDLKALIELHTYNALAHIKSEETESRHGAGNHLSKESNNGFGIDNEQAELIKSAIEINELQVSAIMIPTKDIFMLALDDALDRFKLQLILEKGYSRIPVYVGNNRDDIIGLLRIKSLIGLEFNSHKSLRQYGFELRTPIVCNPRTSLIELLREFKKGKSHLAIVTDQVVQLEKKFGLTKVELTPQEKKQEIKILGIVTLEDVLEKMINIDIKDEDDYDDENKPNKGKNKRRSMANKLNSTIFAQSLIKNESYRLNMLINPGSNSKQGAETSRYRNFEMMGISCYEPNMKDKLIS